MGMNGANGVALEEVTVINGDATIKTDSDSVKTSGDLKAELANEAEQFMAHLRGASNLKERCARPRRHLCQCRGVLLPSLCGK